MLLMIKVFDMVVIASILVVVASIAVLHSVRKASGYLTGFFLATLIYR